MSDALKILQSVFGYTSFRGIQQQVIEAVQSGKDTLGLMPTGGGKSICFQVPALMQEGICLVISPLIALIKDQVENLRKRNVKALCLVGNLRQNDILEILDNAYYGNYKFLYLSPERLKNNTIFNRLSQLPINLVVIDEAHCVSQWGQDFRPSFLEIKKIRSKFPNTPFLALTASANKSVQQDIIKLLDMHNTLIFRSSFERPNLAYKVFECTDKQFYLEYILQKYPYSSIVYVRTRKLTLELAQHLNNIGIGATYFHGGMSLSEKEKNMELWVSEQKKIMVATNAFGMGIDKDNVHNVIHIQLPENIENYYQETGRAGRNGKYAHAILLLSPKDITTAKERIQNNLLNKDFLKTVYLTLCSHFHIAYNDLPDRRLDLNFEAFCQKYKFPYGKTYTTLRFLEQQGVISILDNFDKKDTIRILITPSEVYDLTEYNTHQATILTTLLRMYSGIYDLDTDIDLDKLALRTSLDKNQVVNILKKLHLEEIIDFKEKNSDFSLYFLQHRYDDYTLNVLLPELKKQNINKIHQFESIKNYVEDTSVCKSVQLLKYFDQENPSECGICSVCLSEAKNSNTLDTNQKILECLVDEPKSSRAIALALDLPQEAILQSISYLLEEEKIGIDSKNRYYILA
ncbi:MAG: ATP-dependent DNA helicase RecQ [Bacteroidota bacterium]|nr:ATP-dependent DNA helicase RecQ [Bacteroidota bacterium]